MGIVKWLLREITDADAGGPRCRGRYRAGDRCMLPLHGLLTPVELPLDASNWRAVGPALRFLLNRPLGPLWVFDANTR